ncbi:MAG: hypothetical protein MZV63_49200 [Marinilabiliales bacterium]|nr:hypothetical protein [Marinilabiliales bacterium]
MRGASTAINAIGDGRKAAEQIMRDAGIGFRHIKNRSMTESLDGKGADDQKGYPYAMQSSLPRPTDPKQRRTFYPDQRDTWAGRQW